MNIVRKDISSKSLPNAFTLRKPIVRNTFGPNYILQMQLHLKLSKTDNSNT